MRISCSKRFFHSTALLLAAVLSMSGCRQLQSTAPRAEEPEELSEITDAEIGGPTTEYILPDWESAMRDIVGDANMTLQGKPYLHHNVVSQTVLVYGDSMNDFLGAYEQSFSLDTEEWSAIPHSENFERDGIHYEGIRSPMLSLGDKMYTFARRGDETVRLAFWETDGAGDILSKDDLSTQSLQDEYLIDASGNFITYKNMGDPYVSITDCIADVDYLDEMLEKQARQRINGRILGAVQADALSPVYFYGIDHNGQAVLWSTDESVQVLSGQEELNPREYRAAYTQGGVLCLTDSANIWAVQEGELHKLFHYTDRGYYPQTICGICPGKDETIQILLECTDELILLTYDLSKKDAAVQRQEITAALTMPNSDLDAVIAGFNRQSNKYFVKILLPEQNESDSDFRLRLQMNLASGTGPDLLSSDVFTDLSTMVTNQYVECLDGQGFESMGCVEEALEVSRVSDKLYGIPYDFSLDFAAYRASDMAGENSLTMQKLMEKVRSSDAVILQEYLYTTQLVLRYALSDQSDKTYIDWTAGKSHLAEKPFIELLEFAREYSPNGNQQYEPSEIFAEAPIAAGHGIYDFEGLQYYYRILGSDIAVLGYPRKEGYGIYINTNAFYVNSQSEKKEGAEAFLKYLLSENAQTRYIKNNASSRRLAVGELRREAYARFPVNQAVLQKSMEEHFGQEALDPYLSAEKFPAYMQGEREKFSFLIENAQPAPNMAEISAIVEEVIAPFHDGEKTAQETAKILDNQIQLYLDEHKKK